MRPRIKKEAESKALTVEKLIDLYIERYAKKKKKSWKEDERVLKKELGDWEKMKIADIKRKDIISIVENIVDRGSPVGANRALACFRKMFNFAIERDLLEVNPCIHVKAPSRETQRDRVLTGNEIKLLWEALDNGAVTLFVRITLKLILLTAQRKGEILNAEWDEIDLINKWWVIPASKTKNKMAHRVPLSDGAIELFNQMKAYAGGLTYGNYSDPLSQGNNSDCP